MWLATQRLPTQLNPQRLLCSASPCTPQQQLGLAGAYTGTPPPWQTAQLKHPARHLHTALLPAIVLRPAFALFQYTMQDKECGTCQACQVHVKCFQDHCFSKPQAALLDSSV